MENLRLKICSLLITLCVLYNYGNAMADDVKKYKFMENKLQKINQKFVSISDKDQKRNNKILGQLLDSIIPKMKEKSDLFKNLYTRVFYGGSFYDGLRVGQPDEFDLDLLMVLPSLLKPIVNTSNVPGFVHVELTGIAEFNKQKELVQRYRGIDAFISHNWYLDTGAVLKWMEGLVTKALNTFTNSEITTSLGVFKAKFHKAGPALTLKVQGIVEGEKIKMDIDLVPCFHFGQDKWPQNDFRANPIKKKPGFFVVPKPLKLDNIPCSNRYWRLSFQEQEREIIDEKYNLKPTIKLLKKLRDTQDHKCIASYYIKTVLLWETSDKRGESFWNQPLSYVFMIILKDYYEYLRDGNIPYFWNKKNNLLKNVKAQLITNISNRIKHMIDEVDRNLGDDTIIAKYLLPLDELLQITL